MGKPMTEIELNEQIERLLSEGVLLPSAEQRGRGYRREMRERKNDKKMRNISWRYLPRGPYVSAWFDGKTLLHSGCYIRYPRNSKERKMLKRLSEKQCRRAAHLPRKGKKYRRLLDYWWILD